MPSVINEDKKRINELIKKTYDSNKMPQKVDSADVEEKGFLLANDAKKIQELCKSAKYFVVFRNAGKNTLDRIKEGHPCKGHDILDKTIKKKFSDNRETWTYIFNIEDKDKYVGYVGFPSNSKDTLPLEGIWCFSGEKNIKSNIGDNLIGDPYTGDYDMQDLFQYGSRVLSGSAGEATFLELANVKMRVDAKEWQKWNKYADCFNIQKDNPYSPIRHGAQSSYISYLIGNGQKELRNLINEFISENKYLLFLEKLMDQCLNIKCNDKELLCAIDGEDMYIISNMDELYSYYCHKGVEGEIPYYYFLKNLLVKYPNDKNVNNAIYNLSRLFYNPDKRI